MATFVDKSKREYRVIRRLREIIEGELSGQLDSDWTRTGGVASDGLPLPDIDDTYRVDDPALANVLTVEDAATLVGTHNDPSLITGMFGAPTVELWEQQFAMHTISRISSKKVADDITSRTERRLDEVMTDQVQRYNASIRAILDKFGHQTGGGTGTVAEDEAALMDVRVLESTADFFEIPSEVATNQVGRAVGDVAFAQGAVVVRVQTDVQVPLRESQ